MRRGSSRSLSLKGLALRRSDVAFSNMTTLLLRLIAAGVLVLGLDASIAVAQPAFSGQIDVPPVPPNLEVPAGHTVYLQGHATGTQNYVCLPTSSGPKWKYFAPQATLFQRFWGHLSQQITTHFLASNPLEPGVARPSWQHSFDSSQVWGRSLGSSTDTAFVEPGAIPWLLLEVVGAQRGPTGGSLLARTTFIQRLNTSGGVTPGIDCTEVGAIAMVPYRTDYFFYRARPKR
jgi:hypothetical protein